MEKNGTKYYLISHGSSVETPKRYYWATDEGESWSNIIKNVWKPKHANDHVAESVFAEDVTELDWTKTPLYCDDLNSGWLSRDGRFYGCPERFHDMFSYCVFGSKVATLEESGWVRVFDASRFTCEQRLSAEQRNWLSLNGYKVLDSF